VVVEVAHAQTADGWVTGFMSRWCFLTGLTIFVRQTIFYFADESPSCSRVKVLYAVLGVTQSNALL